MKVIASGKASVKSQGKERVCVCVCVCGGRLQWWHHLFGTASLTGQISALTWNTSASSRLPHTLATRARPHTLSGPS
eukprot:365597-Chlamydomonas_euryale.AAC.7